jgi:hypothetical protein
MWVTGCIDRGDAARSFDCDGVRRTEEQLQRILQNVVLIRTVPFLAPRSKQAVNQAVSNKVPSQDGPGNRVTYPMR